MATEQIERTSAMKGRDMQLHRLRFSLGMMKQLSKDEIVFFVQISQFLQEIMILQKCSIYAANDIKENGGVEQTAQRIQGLFFIKQLAGKLAEGWEMLQKSYFGQAISKEYDNLLSSDGRECLDYIKKYFNQANNLARTIRNEYAFHYGRDQIQEQIDQFPQDESAGLIFSGNLANCMYVLSDDIVNHSLLDMIDPEDHQKAMNRLMDEIVLGVCKNFQKLGCDLMRVILEKLNLPRQQGEPIDISDPPSMGQVTLPYFVTR